MITTKTCTCVVQLARLWGMNAGDKCVKEGKAMSDWSDAWEWMIVPSPKTVFTGEHIRKRVCPGTRVDQ